MFCFNEFAFTVQVKHKINSTQILGLILICLYFTTGRFHTCVLCKECSRYLPFLILGSVFSDCVVFYGDTTLWNINVSKTQATNDKLQGSVAAYLRCGGVVNSQIKKGLLVSVSMKFFLNRWIFGKVTSKSVVVSCTLRAWPTHC